MKFRISLILAFLITSAVLFSNAYGLSWLDDPFVSKNIVSTRVDSFKEIKNQPLSSKSRFDISISTQFSLADLDQQYQELFSQNICIEAFAFQDGTYNDVVMLSVDATSELIPASVMKYITAIVVLSTYEPSHRLETQLVSSENSVNIEKAYIKTTGDPTFVSTVGPVPRRPEYLTPETARTLNDFARNTFEAGVRSIDHLEIENSWFKIPSVESGWSSDRAFVGQLAAFNVDEGFEDNELATNPNAYSAAVLKNVFEQRGISIGKISFGSVPDEANTKIAQTRSKPIIEVVSDMLATSNNIYAEQLLAAATKTEKGQVTLESRSEYVNEVITGLLGKEELDFNFANASGYTRNAKLSCSFLNDAIITFFRNNDIDVADLSSVAGQSGTLTRRFESIEQTIEAKTGTLNGVTALSGKVSDKILFSFIANGSFSQSEGFELQEKAVKPLANFPKVGNLEL